MTHSCAPVCETLESRFHLSATSATRHEAHLTHARHLASERHVAHVRHVAQARHQAHLAHLTHTARVRRAQAQAQALANLIGGEASVDAAADVALAGPSGSATDQSIPTQGVADIDTLLNAAPATVVDAGATGTNGGSGDNLALAPSNIFGDVPIVV
jgi:hypothetical protein